MVPEGSTALGLMARPKDQCGEPWKASPSVACSQGLGRERARDKRLKGTFLAALFRFHLSVAIPEEPTSGLIVGALMI